jgi:hypothetical protein
LVIDERARVPVAAFAASVAVWVKLPPFNPVGGLERTDDARVTPSHPIAPRGALRRVRR